MNSRVLLAETVAAFAQELGPRAITSLRMLAAILLVTLVCGLIYVLQNLRDLKAQPTSGERPMRRANHIVIFVVCAVMFVAACVLLFLVAKAGSPI